MDSLLYITKITDNKTGQVVYIFIDKTTYSKYVSKSKDKYVPLDNEKLENILNNYKNNLIKSSEDLQRFLQSTIKSTLISGGIVLTFLGSFLFTQKQITLIEQESFKRKISIDFNQFDSIISEFNRIVESNDNFNEKEKQLLIDGTKNFFEDWGYLFTEQDIKDLLYRIGFVNLKSKDDLGYNVAGAYDNLNISILTRDDVITTMHECIHCMMHHKGLDGFMDSNCLGRAINEAITESLTRYYYASILNDDGYGVYIDQRKRLFDVSLLIDNEELIKRCFIDTVSIVDIFKENCPGIDEEKVIKYLTLIDMECAGLFEEDYSVDEDFYSEIDSLFNELYKAKYGIDYNNNYDIIYNNFLFDTVTYVEGNCVYEMPKEIFITMNIDELDNENDYIVGLNYNYSDSYMITPLLLLGKDNDEINYISENPNSFMLDLYRKYDGNVSRQQDVINILNLTEYSFDSYFNIYIDLLIERNLHPAVFAAELKKGLHQFEQACFITSTDFDNSEFKLKKWKESLSQKVKSLGDPELSYWFDDTNICFLSYDFYNKNECKLSEYVFEEKSIDNIFVIDKNKVIVNVKEDYYLKTNTSFEYDYVNDNQVINLCNEFFNTSDGTYCIVSIPSEYLCGDDISNCFSEFKEIKYIDIPENIVNPYRNTYVKSK